MAKIITEIEGIRFDSTRIKLVYRLFKYNMNIIDKNK